MIMKTEERFTIDTAIRYQQDHLTEWERVLKPELAAKLRQWAEATNGTETNPDMIRRGDDLTRYVYSAMGKVKQS